jgi:hypothetical protein
MRFRPVPRVLRFCMEVVAVCRSLIVQGMRGCGEGLQIGGVSGRIQGSISQIPAGLGGHVGYIEPWQLCRGFVFPCYGLFFRLELGERAGLGFCGRNCLCAIAHIFCYG